MVTKEDVWYGVFLDQLRMGLSVGEAQTIADESVDAFLEKFPETQELEDKYTKLKEALRQAPAPPPLTRGGPTYGSKPLGQGGFYVKTDDIRDSSIDATYKRVFKQDDNN